MNLVLQHLESNMGSITRYPELHTLINSNCVFQWAEKVNYGYPQNARFQYYRNKGQSW